MDSVVPVQNENFSGDKEVYDSSWSRLNSRMSFILTIRWILAYLVKN